MKPWSERIPAAIAKGEGLVGDDKWLIVTTGEDGVALTPGEVALAKLAARRWKDDCEDCQAHSEPRFGCHEPPPELIAYCKKMEALDD